MDVSFIFGARVAALLFGGFAASFGFQAQAQMYVLVVVFGVSTYAEFGLASFAFLVTVMASGTIRAAK